MTDAPHDNAVTTALNLILTYQTHDYRDLNRPDAATFLSSSTDAVSVERAVEIVTASSFRNHIRVSHPELLAQLTEDVETSKISVVSGETGAGKSTFAGELCDHLLSQGVHAVYINGDNVNRATFSRTANDSYLNELLDRLMPLVSGDDGFTDAFANFLIEASVEIRAAQTAMRLATNPEKLALDIDHARLTLLLDWASKPAEERLADVSRFCGERYARVALVFDNHDGFGLDQLDTIAKTVSQLRSNLSRNSSLVFLVRPTGEQSLRSSLNFGDSVEQRNLIARAGEVLRARSTFASSRHLRRELRRFTIPLHPDTTEPVHPAVSERVVDTLMAEGQRLDELVNETSTRQLDYVTSSYSPATETATNVIAGWHNYNNREVVRSMKVFWQATRAGADQTTDVLRHCLKGQSDDPLIASLDMHARMLMPDVDVADPGLIHLRWRILQFMCQRPEKMHTASELVEKFNFFGVPIEEIQEALDKLATREPYDSGYVRCEQRGSEKLWSVLPAGQWFVSGFAHTVEYLFLLAMSDRRFTYRPIEEVPRTRISEFTDGQRSEIAVDYASRVLISDFRHEHPYLNRDRDPLDLSPRERAVLREFSRLFGYGVSKGWYLSRVLSTAKSFNSHRKVHETAYFKEAASEIEWAVRRLDEVARVAGVAKPA